MQSCHRLSFYKNIFSVNGFHIFTVKYLQPIWMFLLFEIDGLKNFKSTKFKPFHNWCIFYFPRVEQGSTSNAVILQSSTWYDEEGFTPAAYVTDHGNW